MKVAIITEKGTGQFVQVHKNKKLAKVFLKEYFSDMGPCAGEFLDLYDIQEVEVID